MGLGVLYRAALPKRVSLGEDIAVEDLWQQVGAVIARLTSERGSPIAEWFWSHAEEEQLWLHVVPFEENIEFRIEKGLVVVSAKTSGAGPGYHEFVVEVLDTLENEVGLRWNHGEDEGDETGFREARHSGELR